MGKAKSAKQRADNTPNERDNFYVVGLGASAGGIQALKTFFENVPTDSGIAYVVILHLSPAHDSRLAEVLRHSTQLPVTQVTEKTRVEPNNVYVVPPNRHLMMDDGSIRVDVNSREEDRRAPVDIFFRTLAGTHREKAICVVLSGTGANGSMGLKWIKEAGGAAFVQNPREAEFNEMPRNAIATDMVDEVLPVGEIPAKIITYTRALGTVQIPVEAEKRAEDQQQALREIFSSLRLKTGHDFSNYKRPTMLRRIERRINMRNLPDLSAYARFIEQNPEEVTALLKDLLISVTNFFRDSKAFDVLEKDILPAIIKRKKAEEQVRVWIAGCATGEEAYSIAMLCAEQTQGVIEAPKVQIFATDIDEAAIIIAREGYYTLNDAADVSPDRLRRFFNKEGDGYRIRREIREMILFANHNFIKDPPFSHLDLISCRNVLIYLNQSAQERVLETFHFALNPGGYLFLGLSESADSASDLYTATSREFHIFQTRHVTVRTYPVPESVPSFNYHQSARPASGPVPDIQVKERITLGDLHQRLLEEYAPPSIVVDEEYDIVHLSERAGRYLQIVGGEPSQNLLKLVRQELRLELRSALYQAAQKQAPVKVQGLKVNVGDHTETINIHAKPVFREGDVAHGFILVIFEPVSEEAGQKEVVLTTHEPVARHLEDELIRLKTQLRASVEQHEFQSEELKASNEELQAMNEELRSAAEELETSKEELQSINEELRTVNQELKIKVEETTLASNNLQNLINSASIGTIFLDRSFRIALFTPAIREIFNLIPADHGRPLSDITHRLDYHDLLQDAETVLDTLHVIERQVTSSDGKVFMMRVLPYRTAEDKINGVVITFINITTHVRAQQSLRETEERFRAIVSQTTAGIYQADREGWFLFANRKFCEMIGYTEEELSHKSKFDIIYPEDKEESRSHFDKMLTTGDPYEIEKRLVRKNGSLMWVNVSVSPVHSMEGSPVSVVTVVLDITERKTLENQKAEFIGIASHELKPPITSIKSYTEIILHTLSKSSDKKTYEIASKLNSQIDRLTNLVRELLDTTRLSEGKLELRREELDLNELIAEETHDLQLFSEKHKMVVKPGKIRAVYADRERIRQVLVNLLTNALKYSPDGGDITVSSENDWNGVIVRVKDSGIGMTSEVKDKIFQRFYRVNDARVSPFQGLGLGLYIAAEIVRQHNGTIGVDTKPGNGSEFYFKLPYNTPHSST